MKINLKACLHEMKRKLQRWDDPGGLSVAPQEINTRVEHPFKKLERSPRFNARGKQEKGRKIKFKMLFIPSNCAHV